MTTESAGIDVERALRQTLEDLRRAGLTHLPRALEVAALPRAIDTVAAPREAPSLTATAPIQPAAIVEPPTVADEAPAAPRSLLGEPEPPRAAIEKESRVPKRSTLPLADRCAQLDSLKARVAACTRCTELAERRTQTVFGVGDPQARIMFVGEAPGADEDKQGEPFVGRAGQLLNKIIEAAKLKREEVYICNILRCRPPENRTPLPEEAANCREWLDGQIAVIDPDYIVCWGSCAAQNLLDTTVSIGKLRGKFHAHGRAKVLCTYHPSYLLRNPAAKKDVWEDIKFFRKDMGVTLT